MRKAIWLTIVLAAPALTQEKAGSWVGVPLGNGKALRLSTEVSGSGGQTLAIHASMSRSQPNVFHRVLLDGSSHVVFAYDLEISDVASLPLRIQLKPVAGEAARSLAWPLPTFSSVRLVMLNGPGERAAIELLVNPQTHQKIVDVLEITDGFSGSGGASGGVAGAGSTRELRLSHADLFEDGIKLTPNSANAIRGNVVMLSLPDLGGFFFTRDEPKGYGFQKTGVVEGRRLTFTWAGHAYECVSAAPILPDGADRQIWVYHDPQYRPKRPAGLPPGNGFQYGAADSAKSLLGERE